MYEYARLPIEKIHKGYNFLSSLDLAEYVLNYISNIDDIDYFVYGSTRTAGVGPSIAQHILYKSNLLHLDYDYINNACATGVQALYSNIKNTYNKTLFLCSESMSNAVKIYQDTNKIIDSNIVDGFKCPVTNKTMLDYALYYNKNLCIYQNQMYNNEELNEYSYKENIKAMKIRNNVEYNKHIIPFNGNKIDNSIYTLGYETYKKAKMVDDNFSTANICSLADSASYLIFGKNKKNALVKIKEVKKIYIEPKYTIFSSIEMMKKVLEKYDIEDFDIIELHDAFASTGLNFINYFNMNTDKLNVYGSSVAVGHPIAVTGMRLIQNAITALFEYDKQLALVLIPSSLGLGMSVIIERI